MNPPINTHQSSITIKGKMLWPSPDIVTASPDVQEISVHFLFIVHPPPNYDAHHLRTMYTACVDTTYVIWLGWIFKSTQCTMYISSYMR